MVCTTLSATEEPALLAEPVAFLAAVGDLAELDLVAVAEALAVAPLPAPGFAELLDAAPEAAFAAPDFAAPPVFVTVAFAAAGLEDLPDFLPPVADALLLPLLLLASLAVFAALAAVALPLFALGAALAAAPVPFAAPVFDAPLLAADPFDSADLAETLAVVAAFGPVDVPFAADFFPAMIVPSPVPAQAAGTEQRSVSGSVPVKLAV